MNDDFKDCKPEIRPLGAMVDLYLAVHEWTSIRCRLFGADPTLTPQFIKRHEGRWFNRDFFVDLYALAWPIASWLTLWWLGTPAAIRTNYYILSMVGAIWIYRMNELLGGVLYILVKRARSDVADGRKLAISLIAYLEPVFLFSVLHGVVSAVLANGNVASAGVGYEVGGRLWRASTIFHFSVGCYTTVGWGDVTAVAPSAVILSDIEAITGILMLTLTLSRFVAAALDPLMSKTESAPKRE